MQCVSHRSTAAAIAAALMTILVACADPPPRAESRLSEALRTSVERHARERQRQSEGAQKSMGEVGDRIRDDVRRWFGSTPDDR